MSTTSVTFQWTRHDFPAVPASGSMFDAHLLLTMMTSRPSCVQSEDVQWSAGAGAEYTWVHIPLWLVVSCVANSLFKVHGLYVVEGDNTNNNKDTMPLSAVVYHCLPLSAFVKCASQITYTDSIELFTAASPPNTPLHSRLILLGVSTYSQQSQPRLLYQQVSNSTSTRPTIKQRCRLPTTAHAPTRGLTEPP